MKKFILLVPMILLVAAGCNSQPQVQPVNQQTNTQPKQETQIPQKADETANWETYTNGKYGLSFKYPSAYKIKVSQTSSVLGRLLSLSLQEDSKEVNEGTPFMGISVWDNSKNLSFTDWAKDEYNNSFSNFSDGFGHKEIPVDGQKAISYYSVGLGDGRTVITGNNQIIFLLGAGGPGKTKYEPNYIPNGEVFQDFDKLVSTFKFTKSLFENSYV